ncbi:hypothetical protein ACFY8K_35700 [Streptomyces misionensis]
MEIAQRTSDYRAHFGVAGLDGVTVAPCAFTGGVRASERRFAGLCGIGRV